jgi:hypothetical protein
LPDLRDMLLEVGVEITDLWRQDRMGTPPTPDP